MKSVKIFSKKNISLAVGLLVLILFPQVTTSGYLLQTVILMMLYAYWGSAWNIISGYGGQFSLGHAAYVGIGAYVTMILFLYEGVSPWIGMMVAGLISGLASMIIGASCFRLRGSYYTLSTIALLQVFRIIFSTQNSIFGYKINAALGIKVNWAGESFWGMQFVSKVPYYYIILVMFVLCLILCKYLTTSKMGYYLFAIQTNQAAADSLGVNVIGYKIGALFLSAFLTSLGGSFYAFLLTSVEPTTMFSYDLSVKIMLMAVVGGNGRLWGPVVGAFLLVPINEILRVQLGSRLSGLSVIVYGIILMLIILFLQGGLISIDDKIKQFLKKKKAANKNNRMKEAV